MGFYQRNILPALIDRGMQNKAIKEHRPAIPPLASGRVLEVGMGSGLNIPYYSNSVEHLFGLEPSQKLLDKAEQPAAHAAFQVDLIPARAEDIPLEDNAVDCVVSTWTLCSIPEIESALLEMRRVLKPDGRLIFIEHGYAPDPEVVKWQNRLAPILRCLAGCNPNRQIETLISEAGFRFSDLTKDYLDGPRFISYHYIGQATPI